MRRVALISCSKRKLPEFHQAQHFYQGSKFKKSLIYTKGKFDKTYVLSAKYGLVELTDILEPYNLSLYSLSTTQRKQWAKEVTKQIKNLEDIDNTEFTLLAGEAYYENIEKMLPFTQIPLEGLDIIASHKWLNQEIEKDNN